MKRKKLGLLPKLLIGIVIGMLVGSSGSLLGISDSGIFIAIIRIAATFQSLFSSFLQFTIPLLILSFVSVGMAQLGRKANRLFIVTLVLAYVSTVIAGYFAYGVGALTLPHFLSNLSITDVNAQTFDPLISVEFEPIFGVMTALILAFVFGLGIANIENDYLYNVLSDIQDIVTLVLTHIIIPLIPYYIACQFAVIAATGELVETIKMFAVLFVIILITQWVYIALQFLAVSLYTRENAFSKLRNIVPAYFTALGTQSSAATIPINLEAAYKNGVPHDVANFVIPLCATIHLAGDTVCLVLGAYGIMMVSGMTPSIVMFTPFIFALGFTMVAAPGVPGGGVMAALGIITSMLGFTDSMQSLIISLHFSQDSFGTACNITGDQAIALAVQKFDESRASEPTVSHHEEDIKEIEEFTGTNPDKVKHNQEDK